MNDESIPEEDRIYSPSKKYWCGKTSKESSDRFFELLKETKKALETRRISYSDDEWNNLVKELKMRIKDIGEDEEDEEEV